VPLPAGLTLALGGLTYPLYLLHMQLGYVLFENQAPTNAVSLVVTIISAMTLLAWAVWRYLERPAQRWTREFLTRHATRLGWPPKPDVTVGSVAGGGAA
jgi:peptidoglycan/LPS O-acetylase OafA/YrhL